MNLDRCHREDELLDSLGRGLVGPELAAHVEECAACSETGLVAGALLDERMDAVMEAPVPSAGTMLFRLQMRLRQEAQAKARRSLVIGQAMTLVVALVLAGSLFGVEIAVGFREVMASIRLSTNVLIALATWALLAPIAGYVAIKQK
ncbi:MAG TPA: hypothetical protein VMS98_05775 [Thermoanaerobaculia bacterium]|nr:hypothetical protein [Thermoanaerobaculia bacterium]